MELNAIERGIFKELLPQKGNLLEQGIVKDILEKLELSKEELEQIEYKTVMSSEGMKELINPEKAKELLVDIKFDKAELDVVKKNIEVLDRKNEINQRTVGICLRIKEEPKKDEK